MHVELCCSKVRAQSLPEPRFMLVSDTAIKKQAEIPAGQNHVSDLANSDRIRLKFGNYGIDVIENGLRIRVSNLFSMDAGVKTNRTFAVVMYPDVIEAAFEKEHEAIIKGQSIGIVFKENGWSIEKHHHYFGELNPSADFSAIHSVFGDIGEIKPVIHVYSLNIRKDKSEFHYASIAEVHHPGYLGMEELRSIYGNAFDGSLSKDQDTTGFLKIVANKMQGV